MDDARRAARGLDEAYTSSEWVNNLRTHLETARSGQYPRPSTLPSFLDTHEVRSVIDFGGGNGGLAHLIDPKWWSEGGSYTVLEPENTLQHVTSGAMEKVDFVSEQSLVAKNTPAPRMVYALSSMQYLDTTQSLLELVASTRPDFVLLEDVPLSTSEEFCSNQTYHRWLIPYRFTTRQHSSIPSIKPGTPCDVRRSMKPRYRHK